MGRRKFLSVMLGGILCLGNTVPLRSQSRLDSLQHLDEVVVAVRALPKEVIPVQQLGVNSSVGCRRTAWQMP